MPVWLLAAWADVGLSPLRAPASRLRMMSLNDMFSSILLRSINDRLTVLSDQWWTAERVILQFTYGTSCMSISTCNRQVSGTYCGVHQWWEWLRLHSWMSGEPSVPWIAYRGTWLAQSADTKVGCKLRSTSAYEFMGDCKASFECETLFETWKVKWTKDTMPLLVH